MIRLLPPTLTKAIVTSVRPLGLPATLESLKCAEQFLTSRWRARAKEMGRVRPIDLSNACKFASLFAWQVFGGELRGNPQHQFVLLGEQILDLTKNSNDVQSMSDPYQHRRRFFGNCEHLASLNTCIPRVNEWLQCFEQEIG